MLLLLKWRLLCLIFALLAWDYEMQISLLQNALYILYKPLKSSLENVIPCGITEIQESKRSLRECCSGGSRGAVYICRTGCTCQRPVFHTGSDPSRQLLPRYWTTNSHQCWGKWSHTPRACEPNVIRAWLRWGSGNGDERSCWRRFSLRLPSAVLENTKRHEEFQRKCTLRNGTWRTWWLARSSTLVKSICVWCGWCWFFRLRIH